MQRERENEARRKLEKELPRGERGASLLWGCPIRTTMCNFNSYAYRAAQDFAEKESSYDCVSL